jgi:PAS domain S-box-containing protein
VDPFSNLRPLTPAPGAEPARTPKPLLAMVIEVDLEGRIEFVDAYGRSVLGAERALEGVHWLDACVPEMEQAQARERIADLVGRDTDLPIMFDGHVVDGDDECQRVRWHSVVRRGAARQATGVRLNGVLVGRENSPAMLSALDQLLDLRFAIDAAAIVAVTDRKGVITYANDTFCRISGYAREELLGQSHRLINSGFHPPSFFAQLWNTISVGRVWRGDICNKANNGRLYWTATTIVPYLDREGNPYQFLAIRTDVTDRKAVEATLARTIDELETANRKLVDDQSRLLQAEKLSSVGMLAAGVAHEINNPLGGVMACIKALQDGRVGQQRRDTYFTTVIDGLERIQGIVQALLNYARPVSSSRSPVVPEEVIESCLVLLTPGMQKKRVHVEHATPGRTAQVQGDRSQLMQAIMNVVLNALHATPHGSAIRIDHPERPGFVGVRIEDSGSGIPPELVDRVCDPFFSTKPEGEGTGLGLSVTHGIITAHGGHLQISRSREGGAQVTLWLREIKEAVA